MKYFTMKGRDERGPLAAIGHIFSTKVSDDRAPRHCCNLVRVADLQAEARFDAGRLVANSLSVRAYGDNVFTVEI